MKQKLIALIFLIIFESAFSNSSKIRVKSGESYFRVTLNSVGNFIYNLDCLTEMTQCSLDNYIKLWKDKFLKNDEDFNQIKKWNEVRVKYYKSVSTYSAKDIVPLSYPLQTDNVDAKFQMAAFESQTLEEFFEKIKFFIQPDDLETIKSIVKKFWPKYFEWWNQVAEVDGNEFKRRIFFYLADPKISEQVQKIEKFYAPDVAKTKNTTVQVNLIFLPPYQSGFINGLQIGNHSVIEFTKNDTPESKIDVLVHELCHFYFRSISVEDHRRLTKLLVDKANPLIVSQINLMNEILATTFGNALIKKVLLTDEEFKKIITTPQSLYANEAYDQGAKFLYEAIQNELASDLTLVSEKFVNIYYTTLYLKIRSLLELPEIRLKFLDVFTNMSDFMWIKDELPFLLKGEGFQLYGADDDIRFEKFKKNPHQNALIVLDQADFRKSELLKKMMGEIFFKKINDDVTKNKVQFQKFNRTKVSTVYLLIYNDLEKAKKTLKENLLK